MKKLQFSRKMITFTLWRIQTRGVGPGIRCFVESCPWGTYRGWIEHFLNQPTYHPIFRPFFGDAHPLNLFFFQIFKHLPFLRKNCRRSSKDPTRCIWPLTITWCYSFSLKNSFDLSASPQVGRQNRRHDVSYLMLTVSEHLRGNRHPKIKRQISVR